MRATDRPRHHGLEGVLLRKLVESRTFTTGLFALTLESVNLLTGDRVIRTVVNEERFLKVMQSPQGHNQGGEHRGIDRDQRPHQIILMAFAAHLKCDR